MLITENFNRETTLTDENTVTPPLYVREPMMRRGESRKEAPVLITPLVDSKHRIKVANWNVRTLYRSGNAAQAAREMSTRNIDIMGISETHWTGQGKIILENGETIIYSGRDDDIHREGVGIMMSQKAAQALMDWTPINERIITARFYSNHIKLTIIHAYAPTEDADEQDKDKFYEQLQEVLNSRKKHDMLIVTGDMNAKVGSDNKSYESVMGKHGEGNMNDNGERLCEICQMNELVITGTLFPHKRIHKLTWTSPDGVTKNQIDHTLINKRFRNSVNDTRVFRSADIASDHHLVVTTIKLRLKKVVKKSTRAKYNLDLLKNEDIKNKFTISLKNRYEVLADEVPEGTDEDHIEKENEIMEKAYQQTAKAILGKPRAKKKPWISGNSWELIDQRNELNKKILSTRSERLKNQLRDKFKEKNKEIKKSIKADKRKWFEDIATEAETASRNQHMKTLYRLTKTLCNDKPKQSTSVMDKNGRVISGRDESRKRWKEHFTEVLNRDEPENPIILTDLENEEHLDNITEIDDQEPTLLEIKRAIRLLKNGKSSGIDSITAELLKADINFATEIIHNLFKNIWAKETIPKNWKKGLIIKLPKKGNLKECKNWRGITLLPIVGKILGRIIIDRITSGVDKSLRKEQGGFRKGRGTAEQIFVLRNIMEQTNEWQASLYLNFVDFEKAFDSIHRESLWTILKEYGIPNKLINIIRLFYDGFQCAVDDNGEEGEWFNIKTGVKQGCNMSGFLFLIILDKVMRKAVGNGENGIRWKLTSKLDDLDFADDIVLISSTKKQIQEKTTRLNEEAKRVGLKVNVDKTKIMRINAKYQDRIVIDGNRLDDVEEFSYLGATISKDGGGTRDMKNRLSKARGTFVRLRKIWSSKQILRKTKLKLFNTLVIPVLLYGCETWKTTKNDNKAINVFQSKCLRRILNVKWNDYVTNQEILERSGASTLSEEVKRRRWKFIGHILRQDPNNDCNVALTWAPEGKRKRGRPKTTWRRTVESERTQIGWKNWKEARTAAVDRQKLEVEELCEVHYGQPSVKMIGEVR